MQMLSFNLIFMLNAIVATLFGLAFLFVPESVLRFFGTETFVATILVSRFFGTAMLALGLVLWFAREVHEAAVQRGIALGLLAGAIAGLMVTLVGTFASNAVLRSNAWIAIVIYILFGGAYAYLVFGRRETPSEV